MNAHFFSWRHRQRRGQAAIEYIITYGWAVVIIMVVIGVLLFFGIINPTKLISDNCDFGLEIPCDDGQVGSDGHIILALKNDMGDDIIIPKIETTELSFAMAPDQDILIRNGMKGYVYVQAINSPFVPGEKTAVKLRVYFHRANPVDGDDPSIPPPTYNITGQIFTTVCAGTFVPGTLNDPNDPPHFTRC